MDYVYSQTVSETFYGPNCPVDEGNEELGQVWDDVLLFYRLLRMKLMASVKKPRHEGKNSRRLSSFTSWGGHQPIEYTKT